MNHVNINITSNDYSITEAYKTLRTNLQFCGEDKKVITVTSCTPDEGKSSVSLNLSIALAEAGKRTLLVDCDMRKSVLLGETRPSMRDIKGLTHFVSGQSELQDVICMTNIPDFHIIYSGPFPPNPSELLNSAKFSGMIKALRKVYDYVIVDTPPLANVIDSAIVAKNCDGAVIVIEAGVISYHLVQNVKDQLEKSGCPVLGAVLNKVDMQNSGYGKYYGKKYGQYGKAEA